MQYCKDIKFTSVTIHPDDPRYPYAAERAIRDDELREYLKRHTIGGLKPKPKESK